MPSRPEVDPESVRRPSVHGEPMAHTVTDSPDPSVTAHGRRYLATDRVLATLGRRTDLYRHHARPAAQPIPVVVLERVEEQQ